MFTKYVRHHRLELGKWRYKKRRQTGLWVTNLPSVVSLKMLSQYATAGGRLKTNAAGEIVNTWNADHVYRHNQNAISAFIIFLFIVLNIFNIFFSRNIKDRRISTKSFLIDLVKAEFLLAKWLTPIPL